MSEDIAFCMIPTKEKDGKVFMYPHPSLICHCQTLEKKHFQIYGKYNNDRTGMIPSSEADVKALEEYYNNLK